MNFNRVLVSVAADGTLGNAASGSVSASLLDNENHLDISGNGRFVAFESLAGNLSGSVVDNNSKSDVFLKDLQTGQLHLISSKADGSLLSNSVASLSPEVSEDGRYVVFQGPAVFNNAGGSVTQMVVYQKDLSTGSLTIVSASHLDAEAGTGLHPSMSADGRYVVYDSGKDTSVYANGLVVDGMTQVFLRDMQTLGNSRLLSETAAGVDGNAESNHAHMSDDGKRVVFETAASNLLVGDSNGRRDIALKDLTTDQLTAVSSSQSGVPGNGDSYNPMLSGNGRYVVFESSASNLIDGVTVANAGKLQIYRKDLQTGEVRLVSVKADNTTINASDSTPQNTFNPKVSADGRFVIFYDGIGNSLGTTIGVTTYLKDMATGALTELDPTYNPSSSPNTQLVAAIDQYALSADGRYLVLATKQGTMLNTPSGADATLNVFRYDLSSITSGNGSAAGTVGGSGDDLFVGTAQNEAFDGGAGFDTVSYAKAGKGVTADLSKGTASGGGGNDTFKSIEHLIGSDFNDQLLGDDQNNRLDGGKGADKLLGGGGNDIYVLNELNGKTLDKVTETLNQGADTVQTPYSYVLPNHVEYLQLTGSNAVNSTGNALNNRIQGNDGANIVNGKEGSDILIGGNGNDVFRFDSKIFTKLGGMVFPINGDVIEDFKSGSDAIHLAKKIFSKAVADTSDKNAADGLSLSRDDLVTGLTLTDALAARTGNAGNAHLLFAAQTLYYDSDGAGATAPIPFVVLTGVATLTASDLALV